MMFLITVWSAMHSAHAESITFCATYQVNYLDAADVGDDFFTNNAINPIAIGAKITVFNDLTGVVQTLWADQAGCTPAIGLHPQYTYTVRIHAEGQISGHSWVVKDHPTETTWYSGPALGPGWSPPVAGGTFNIVTPNVHEAWNIAAIAGVGLWLHGPNAPIQMVFVTDKPLPCSNPAKLDADMRVVFCVNEADKKSLIAHEMGHGVLALTDEGRWPAGDKSLDPGNCFSNPSPLGKTWDQNSKEDSRVAALEGFGDFYAAVIFNRSQPGDECFLDTRGKQDWNLDGLNLDNHDKISCILGPYDVNTVPNPPLSVPNPPIVDDRAYMEDHCNLPWDNRGVAWDWTRFLWDLKTTTAYPRMTMAEILEVFDSTNMRFWLRADETIIVAAVLGYPQYGVLASEHGVDH